MSDRRDVPAFFIYGEPSRSLDVGFFHVETVMARRSLHLGHVAPHRHPSMGQITSWFQGGGTYRIEDEAWSFSAPAVSFVPSGVVHGFDVEAGADAVVVSVSDDRLRAISVDMDVNLAAPVFAPGRAGDPSFARLSGLLEMAAAEYRERGMGSASVLSGLTHAALALVGRLGGSAAAPAASPSLALALALRQAVDAHYRSGHPVAHYVELLGTTPHRLDRAARAVFERSVKDMILDRRLLEAKRLLLITIRLVEDVGREIGFDDPAYFSRFFRQRAGRSPTVWREEQLRGNAGKA